MAVTALLPGTSPTVPTTGGTTAPPALPQPGADAGLRLPDVVVFSSAPFRLLAELATTGVQQLAALLPALEQAVAQHDPSPFGRLAKAAGEAARQVAEGHVALLAEGPDRIVAALPRPSPPRPDAPAENGSPSAPLPRSIAAPGSPMAALPADVSDRTTAQAPGGGTPPNGVPLPAPLAQPSATPGRLTTMPAEVRERADAAPLPSPPDVGAPFKDFPSPVSLTRPVATPVRLAAGMPAEEPARASARDHLLVAIEKPFPETGAADPAGRWIAEAKHLLGRTGDALDQAEQQLRPSSDGIAETPLRTDWALAQIAAAQVQVAATVACLGRVATPARGAAKPSSHQETFSLGQLTGATRSLGLALVAGAVLLLAALWSVSAGAAVLAATAYAVWRLYRATRGVALDAAR